VDDAAERITKFAELTVWDGTLKDSNGKVVPPEMLANVDCDYVSNAKKSKDAELLDVESKDNKADPASMAGMDFIDVLYMMDAQGKLDEGYIKAVRKALN